MLGSTAIVLIIFPSFFIQIFTSEPEVIKNGTIALRVISFGYVGYSYGMVMVQSLNGAGDTRTPLIINFISFWLIEMPSAYFFGIHLGYGHQAVYYAIVAGETVMTLLALYVFRKGNWKLKEV